MTFDDLKTIATFFLQNYEAAWAENTALRLLLESYPMPDGKKGIPHWEEIVKDWIEWGRSHAHDRFAPLYERIQSAQQESDVLELLRKVPPVGSVQ